MPMLNWFSTAYIVQAVCGSSLYNNLCDLHSWKASGTAVEPEPDELEVIGLNPAYVKYSFFFLLSFISRVFLIGVLKKVHVYKGRKSNLKMII